MGIREVGFYTNGEPLLDKNILNMLRKIYMIMYILQQMEYLLIKIESKRYLIVD